MFTIGHSTRTIEAFIALLRENAVDLVADVRSIPRSRTNPQFNADALGPALAAAGIQYRAIAALGGRRHRRKDAGPSPNALWRHEAFRSYADYAMTAPFRAGLETLRSLGRTHRVAIMCAEAVWWRCHRRIIADYLLAAGVPVTHIMAPGRREAATMTPGARAASAETLVYPAARSAPQG